MTTDITFLLISILWIVIVVMGNAIVQLEDLVIELEKILEAKTGIKLENGYEVLK